MDDKEDRYEYTDTAGSVESINEEHSYCGDNGSSQRSLPVEEVERWPEVWSRAYLQKKTGQVHNQKCHLRQLGTLLNMNSVKVRTKYVIVVKEAI